MSVLTTIHQPQSLIFHLFDRVILLSEGYTIYNGPPSGVKGYLEQFGFMMGRYANPADKLSQVAGAPKQFLTKGNNLIDLVQACKT